MNFNVEWYSPNLGTPIVSIAEYGIVFNKASIVALGSPYAIKLGFDKEKKCIVVLGVNESEYTEDAIVFKDKEKSGFIRINNKDFIRFILRYCPELRLDKAKRFLSIKESD
ncbi:hypothetical protein, partial [Alkalibacillus haloalkaliphilus]|uniref:hypothetical protein n=1 Tax=Alkalibacillus haloalkaliphilus TaxID=94136 RepID=UPI001ED93027